MTQENKEIDVFTLKPKTLEEAMKFADLISKSGLVPDVFKGKPGDILIAVQMGLEIGLSPTQALQNIAIINGRPCLWGDAVLAVVQSHADYEWIKETSDANGTWAECAIKRRGHEPHTVRWTIEDAKKAKLYDKPGPWQNYPKRMLQMRARSWAVRDAFADALRGMRVAEEQGDVIETTAEVIREPQVLANIPLESKSNVQLGGVGEDLTLKADDSPKEAKITPEQRLELMKAAKSSGLTIEAVKSYLKIAQNVETSADLTVSQFPGVMAWVAEQGKAATGA